MEICCSEIAAATAPFPPLHGLRSCAPRPFSPPCKAWTRAVRTRTRAWTRAFRTRTRPPPSLPPVVRGKHRPARNALTEACLILKNLNNDLFPPFSTPPTLASHLCAALAACRGHLPAVHELDRLVQQLGHVQHQLGDLEQHRQHGDGAGAAARRLPLFFSPRRAHAASTCCSARVVPARRSLSPAGPPCSPRRRAVVSVTRQREPRRRRPPARLGAVASAHLSSSYRGRGRAKRSLFQAAPPRGNRPPLPRCPRAVRCTLLLPVLAVVREPPCAAEPHSCKRARWPAKHGHLAALIRASHGVLQSRWIEGPHRPWLGTQKGGKNHVVLS